MITLKLNGKDHQLDVTEDMPLLVIHDGGHVPQELFPPRAPWQTTMYVLPYLHPQASSTAQIKG